MSDIIRAAYFHAVHLLLALRAGEPRRLSLALATEALHVATAARVGRARAAWLNRRAFDLAHEIDDPYTIAWSHQATAAAAFQVGEWRTCLEDADRAEPLFRNRCRGVVWELSSNHIFALAALFYLGDLHELSVRLPRLLMEADEWNDWYSMVNLRIGYNTHAWLAADDVERARREAIEAMGRWSLRGYHAQHFYALISHHSIDLYGGDAPAALKRTLADWPALKRSLLLRVGVLRVKALVMRATAALAIASQGHEREKLLRDAERDARRIEREKMTWSDALAQLLHAGISATRGEPLAAIASLDAAAAGFDAANMALHAAAARFRRGELVGGDEGRALCANASGWMERQRIKSPARMMALIAPGFPAHA